MLLQVYQGMRPYLHFQVSGLWLPSIKAEWEEIKGREVALCAASAGIEEL